MLISKARFLAVATAFALFATACAGAPAAKPTSPPVGGAAAGAAAGAGGGAGADAAGGAAAGRAPAAGVGASAAWCQAGAAWSDQGFAGAGGQGQYATKVVGLEEFKGKRYCKAEYTIDSPGQKGKVTYYFNEAGNDTWMLMDMNGQKQEFHMGP